MGKYYLGVDQGTTGVCAVLFDKNWKPVAKGYEEVNTYYPAPGHSEHDPIQIFEAVKTATAMALRNAKASPDDIIALGLDHEGESILLWDIETGKPVYPVIVWQDRRTAERAKEIAASHGDLIRERTMLSPDSYFSATKIEWVLKHIPEAAELQRKGRLLAGNMDAWLLFQMTGGICHATDASTASRTMLYNVNWQVWDPEICHIFGIDPAILPEVGDSFRHFGESDPDKFLGIKAPITALLNDQQAALLGQGCIKQGTVKTTYGTGCFMLMQTGTIPILSKNKLVPTVAWQAGDEQSFALDGGIYTAGSATRWLKNGLKIIKSAKECSDLALSVKDNGGLYFVPAFNGLAAPHWDPYATGMMIGLTPAITAAHVVRATSEAIAYQVADLAAAMEKDAGMPVTFMRCDGGAAGDKFLMQFQADMLGATLEVPTFTEASALGAALGAAIGMGEADLATAENLPRECCHYEPCISADQRASLLCNWHRAVERAKEWREH